MAQRYKSLSGLTGRWARLRRAHLAGNPLCVYCQQQGRVSLASVVDHVIPHRGDPALYLGGSNLQSLCKPHHDASKQKAERTGHVQGCDAAGVPIDRRHLWRMAQG